MLVKLVRLTPLSDGLESAELPLTVDTALIIGRAPEVDYRVIHESVGRRVVRLSIVDGKLHVEDLASGGGSALEIDGDRWDRYNGVVPDGAVLWIGQVGFRVQIE